MPYTVAIRISNIGSREVIGELTSPDRSDYIQPLVVDFGDSVCYEARITESSNVPLNNPLPTIISKPANKFPIQLPTLNIASWVQLDMIADGTEKYPEISCFLEGQTEKIEPVAGRQRSRVRSASLIACGAGLVMLIVGFGLLGLFAYNPQGPGDGPPILMGTGATVAILAIMVFASAWLQDWQERNAMRGRASGLFSKRN